MDVLKFNGSEVAGLEDYESDAALAAVNLFKDYDGALLHFAGTCCFIFMMIGIPGNLITIIALSRCRKVRNATAMFIINLSFSDLLFGSFVLPLQASTFWQRAWIHGKFLCRMLPLARYALVAVSLFTILAITINRYVLISYPMLYPRLYKKLHLSLMIIGIWVLPVAILLPTYFEVWGRFSLDHITGSCSIVPDESDRSPKKFLFTFAFALPSIAIIICYARILWIVRKATKLSHGPVFRRPMSAVENMQVDGNNERLSTVTQSRRNLSQIVPTFKDGRCQLPMCFFNTGAELSSSVESTTPEELEKRSRTNARTLGTESKSNFRKSFIATFKRPAGPTKPRGPTKKDKKLLTMIVAIMVSFFVCHLPITLTKTISQEFTSHPIANIIGYVLIYMTTCINPIIYVVMSSEYRQAYKNLWKCGR